MMRRVDYEEWKRLRKSLLPRLVALENTFHGHAPGRRPRDPEKESLLIEMDKTRLARYLLSGKLTILGPRKWKWRIGGK